MSYQIRQVGHDVLRAETVSVEDFGKPLRSVARAMFETMRVNKGVGLAAPQIGKSLRVVVIHAGGFRAVLVNPVILSSFGSTYEFEGCLSVPQPRWCEVRRALSVHIRWYDLDGNVQSQQLDGFAARVVQHELDHLVGKLITDL